MFLLIHPRNFHTFTFRCARVKLLPVCSRGSFMVSFHAEKTHLSHFARSTFTWILRRCAHSVKQHEPKMNVTGCDEPVREHDVFEDLTTGTGCQQVFLFFTPGSSRLKLLILLYEEITHIPTHATCKMKFIAYSCTEEKRARVFRERIEWERDWLFQGQKGKRGLCLMWEVSPLPRWVAP